MELIRILKNKKFIVAAVVLLLLNCAVFYVMQQKNVQEYGFAFSDYTAVFRENAGLLSDGAQQVYAQNEKFQVLKSFADFETLKAADAQEYAALYAAQETALIQEEPVYYEEYKSGKYSFAQITLLAEFYAHFAAQLDYQNGYSAYIDSVLEKGSDLSSRKLFSDKNSFSNKSIQKTTADYAQNKNIALTPVNDYPASAVLTYQVGDLVLVLLCAFTAVSFLSGRDLQLLINTCKKGRASLKARQILILVALSFVFSVLVYVPEILLAQKLYAIPFDVTASIQSSQMFADSVLQLNFLQLFAVLIAFKAALAAAAAMLILLLISLFSNIAFVCTLFGAFVGAEFVMYQSIPVHSTVSFFKTVNVFSLLDYTSLTKYELLPLFSVPVRADIVIYAVLCLLFVVLFALLLVVSVRSYPVRSPAKLFRYLSVWSAKFSVFYAKVQNVLYGRRFETFKIMHTGRGLVILAVFFVIVGVSLNTNALVFSPVQTYLNDYYAQYGGKLDAEVYTSLDEIQQRVDAAQAEFDHQAELFSQGSLTLGEYEVAKAKNEAYVTQREALQLLRDQVASIEKLQQRGIEPVLMNEIGYNSLFSGQSIQNGILLTVCAVILMFSGTFAAERGSGMHVLNHSAKRGRLPLTVKKFAAVLLPVFLLCAAFYLAAVYRADHLFGLSDLDANIQNLQLLQNVSLNVSLLGYLVLGFVFAFVLVTATACIVVALSSFLPQIAAAVAAGAVFLLPSLLYAANILPVRTFAVTEQFSLNSVLLAGQGIGAFTAQLVLLAAAVALMAICIVRECRTRAK